MRYYCHLPCAISCSRKLLRKCIHGKLLCCCCCFAYHLTPRVHAGGIVANRQNQSFRNLSPRLSWWWCCCCCDLYCSIYPTKDTSTSNQLSIPHGQSGGGGSATASTDNKVLLTICCTKSHKTWFTHSVWLITQFSWPEPLKARLLSIPSSSSAAAASSYWTQCKSALEGGRTQQQQKKKRRTRSTNCTASTITIHGRVGG